MRELTTQELDLVAGGFNFGPSSTTYVNANIHESVNIYKDLYSATHVYGNLALAEADANAYGYNTSTQAVSTTNVVQNYASASTATSVSAANR